MTNYFSLNLSRKNGLQYKPPREKAWQNASKNTKHSDCGKDKCKFTRLKSGLTLYNQRIILFFFIYTTMLSLNHNLNTHKIVRVLYVRKPSCVDCYPTFMLRKLWLELAVEYVITFDKFVFFQFEEYLANKVENMLMWNCVGVGGASRRGLMFQIFLDLRQTWLLKIIRSLLHTEFLLGARSAQKYYHIVFGSGGFNMM